MSQKKETDSPPVRLKSLGERLRSHRLRLGLSQEALAEAIGASARSIRRWEQDLVIPQEAMRTRLSQLFGIDPQSLLGAWSNEQASFASSSFWHVPLPRNSFFTGREELLHTLHERLKSEQNMALTQSWAISGLGGIGKTQIALEYAYQHRQDYVAVFWISAATQESLQAGLAALAELLQLPEKDEHDHQRVIRAVKQWLATHQEWLLILDNADDVTIVQDVLPTERSGHLVLTTRAQALGPVAQRMEVETMGLAEGTLFLLRRARVLAPGAFLDQASQEHLAAAEAITIEMDFLPLALDQAGAYIEEVGCSLSTYLELYRSHRAELLHRRGHMPGDYPESVATTWSLNFQQVTQANLAAAELLRLCAFLEPDAIPEELVSEGGAALGPVLQSLAMDALALNEAIEELRKFSLVQRDPEARLLRIHRLVQAVLKDTLEMEGQRQWAERAVRATNMVFPETVEMTTWPRCLRFLSQAQGCSTMIQEYAFAFTDAAALLFRVACYLQDHALYEQAEPLYQRALHIQEHTLGSEHPETARSLQGLAALYRSQGKYEQVEPLLQRALRIQEHALGSNHPDVARSLNHLASVYGERGKYEQVEALCQRALFIWEQVHGSEHPDMGPPLTNLATLYSMQGKYEQAETLFQRVLCILEQALGPEHPRVAASLTNLAFLYNWQRKSEQEVPLLQRALHIQKRTLGPDHPDVARSLNNLASAYAEQGKYEQVEPLYQRALCIWEQRLGANHTMVAHPLAGLANLYVVQGKYVEAEPLLQRALSIREQALGEHHFETAEILHGLAALREAQNRYREAIELYQRALVIWEQTVGPEHPTTLATRTKYLALLQAMDQEHTQGPEHPETARSL